MLKKGLQSTNNITQVPKSFVFRCMIASFSTPDILQKIIIITMGFSSFFLTKHYQTAHEPRTQYNCDDIFSGDGKMGGLVTGPN